MEALNKINEGFQELLKPLFLKIEEIESTNSEIKEKVDNNEALKAIQRFIPALNQLREDLKTLDNKVDTLYEKFNKASISKDIVLKLLQEDGNINLRYNLQLTPRILPKKAENGMLLIDAKDGRLKYFNNEWIIL